MSAPPPVKSARPSRPLSPHLQIYRPQLTSALSIFHRMTGIALAFGLPMFVLWLVALSYGPGCYQRFILCCQSIPGQVILFGWTFSFFYHFCSGIRHVLWDAGFLLEIKQVYSSGRIVIGVSVLLTIGIWLKTYCLMHFGWML